MPRRTWLDSKIDVFLEELAASGMHLDVWQRAGKPITGQVRAVTALDGSHRGHRPQLSGRRDHHGHGPADAVAGGRRTARRGPAGGAADRSAAAGPSGGHRRGPGRGDDRCGRRNEPPGHLGDVITTYAQTLFGFGQITAGAGPGQACDPAEDLFPPVLLRRAARYIGGAADLAANGGKLPDGKPETARNHVAATLPTASRRCRTDRDRDHRLTRHTGDPAQFPQGARRSTAPARSPQGGGIPAVRCELVGLIYRLKVTGTASGLPGVRGRYL